MLYIRLAYIASCVCSHRSPRPHTCSSLPARPRACVGHSTILWFLLLLDTCQLTCPSAVQPCLPSALRAPSFLGTEKLVNGDWKVLESCTTPGQEPAAYRTWPVNVLSARQAVQKPLLTCQWRCRGGGTQVPVALGVWMQPLCWEQELARTFQLVLALSHGAFNLPFDLTTSSPGADFFE